MYLQQMVDYPEKDENPNIHKVEINVTYPTSLDWRTKGFVSSVSTH